MTEPREPEDVATVAAVAELLWQLDESNRPNVPKTFTEARAAESTGQYERAAVELWQRGWLNTTAVVSDAGGPNSA